MNRAHTPQRLAIITRGLALTGGLALLAGCPQEQEQGPASPDDKIAAAPASAPASQPGSGAPHGAHPGGTPKGPPGEGGNHVLPPRPASDADYTADPDVYPDRLGVKRVFMRQDKVNHLRDPAFIPGTDELVVMAKVGGVQGVYRMPRDGSEKAKLVVPRPLYTPGEKVSARNRRNWYIGTPAVFPDGKHVIFDGTQWNPRAQFPNVLGLAPLSGGGTVSAVELEGLDIARTPAPMPDGEHIIFSTCTELRKAKLDGFGDQKIESEVIVELPRLDTKNKSVCTVHRPRPSPDGNQIVFEVVGQFLADDFKEKHDVPQPKNQGDYLIEPWIVNADGTGLRRLVDDKTYERDLHTRLQTGGSKEPAFSPDGEWVVFAHGRNTALVTPDGKKGHIIATPVVETNRAVQYLEGDPTFSSDGRYVAVASGIMGNEENPKPAPPGVAVIDLEELELEGE